MSLSHNFNDVFANSFDFDSYALELFRVQARETPIYRDFVSRLGVAIDGISRIEDIPFLPVEFFKHKPINSSSKAEAVFSSSGTSGSVPSYHHVADIELYRRSFTQGFQYFYGEIQKYCVLGLLPGYLEREGSSLIFMVKEFIDESKFKSSGFYLHNYEQLAKQLNENEAQGIPTLLLGVTFGLLDFAERYSFNLKNTIVMETGGMKGRREEMLREEVHRVLCSRLGVDSIHSEYGMTELLSQAYSSGNGIYKSPPWMKVLLYDLYNPLHCTRVGKGGVNIIDLANLNSCAFIQTQDIGMVYSDESFEILGRFDASEIRGCNLLVV